MEEQMTLQRIRRNNEKIIFRIGDPMLAGPAGTHTAPAAAKTNAGGYAGNYEDGFHHPKAGSDIRTSPKVFSYL